MSDFDLTFRRDIKTSNPRKFFRFLKNTIRDMGYRIGNDSINIQQDAVGDVGVINGSLKAEEDKVGETSYKERVLSLSQAIFVILVGVGLGALIRYHILSRLGVRTGSQVFFHLGAFIRNYSSYLIALSVLIILGGIFGFLYKKEKVREEPYTKEIEIESEGEVYSGKKKEEDTEESKVISELTILMKGRTTNGEEINGDINEDIDKLKDHVTTFLEG